MAKDDDWELWIDDRNTASPEEIAPAERKQLAEVRMEEIYRKFFEEDA